MLTAEKVMRICIPVLGEDSAAFDCLYKTQYVPTPGFCGLPVRRREPGFFIS